MYCQYFLLDVQSFEQKHIFYVAIQVVSHLCDAVKKLEKERDVQAADIKKMKGSYHSNALLTQEFLIL